MLSINDSTVYRALCAIEKDGLIVRNDQTGINTISKIAFTPLGLTVPRDVARINKASDIVREVVAAFFSIALLRGSL